jgi:hypothetical protein
MSELSIDRSQILRKSRVALLIVILPLLFRDFYFLPGGNKPQEVWNVLALFYFIYLLIVGIRGLGRPGKGLSIFSWYIMGLGAVIPLWVTFAAWNAYGQPPLYGLLAEREMFTIPVVIFFERSFKRRFITFREVKIAMLLLAWTTFILWLFFRIALSPASFVQYRSFSDGVNFFFPTHFLTFGIFYYLLRGFRTGKFSDYMIAIALFSVTVGPTAPGVRHSLLFLLLTFIVQIVLWSSKKQLLYFFPKFLITLFVLGLVLFLAMPDTMEVLSQRMQDAFTVVLSGENVQDAGANARIGETAVALEGISKHPFIGNGEISRQWQGGTLSIVGEYFYWVDIGIIGVIYFIGIAGFILCVSQFGFLWGARDLFSLKSSDDFMDTVSGILLLCLFTAILASSIITDIRYILFFILIFRTKKQLLTSNPQATGLTA